MKTLTTILAALALTPLAARAQDRFQQEAFLILSANEVYRIWIDDANDEVFRYYETERGVDSKQMSLERPQSIWLIEPPEFTAAFNLYQSRQYNEARKAFAEVREEYLKLREIPDNHSARAAFYEMECLRQLGRWDDLIEAEGKFTPDDRKSLTRDHEIKQLDHYVLYDALRKQQWSRLEGLAEDRLEQDLPGYQLAQAAYALGLALEAQDRPLEALDPLNVAIVADSGRSEVIARNAALKSLRILAADEGVKQAIEEHGTDAEEPRSERARLLAEAGAMARLYQLTLGGGRELPIEVRDLLKYAPELEEPVEEGIAPGTGEGEEAAPAEEGGE